VNVDIAPAAPAHPLFEQLATRHGFTELTAESFDEWIGAPGNALVVFVEEPAKIKESLDLAVIAPELVRAFPGALRAAALMPSAARALAVRYGLRRWPALVVLRDGGYVGAIEGLRSWDEYLGEFGRLLAAPVTRPPSIGVAVAHAAAPGCH
jgi:hydrogenase-1 operon protein HyaE